MFKKIILYLSLIVGFRVYAQNVGIGTSTPLQKLHVAGNLQFDGALMPGGLPGSAGEVLISQGPGIPPIWGSSTNGQQWATVYSTASLTIPYSLSYSLVPGLSTTVTIPAGAVYDVYISTDGAVRFDDGTNANRGAQAEISIWVDGTARRYISALADNSSNLVLGLRNFATSFTTTLTPGVHTVEVYARHRTSSVVETITVASGSPTSYLRSSLTVGVIKR